MLNITDMLLTNSNRPKKKLVKLKGVVIHYTANTNRGADAAANRNYFNNTQNAVSAHYIVDDRSIIRCVPDDEVAYHVGAKKYTAIGQSLIEQNYSPNFFLIGIEMCVNSDGDWKKTYDSTIALTTYLLRKYNLTINNLYRHYDITDKECPKMMLEEAAWKSFKDDVARALSEVRIIVNGSAVNMDIIIKDNQVYVPVRQMAKALGAEVQWEPQNSTVTVSKPQ